MKEFNLSESLLDEIIQYVEDTDQQIEHEWGSCRSLEKVKEAKEMPDIYYKLIDLRNNK